MSIPSENILISNF